MYICILFKLQVQLKIECIDWNHVRLISAIHMRSNLKQLGTLYKLKQI